MRKPLLAYAGAVAIASVIGLAILPGPFAKLRRAVAPHVPQAVRECYSWTIAAARREPPFLYAFLSSRFASGVSERRAAGSELFQEFCSACHGIEEANASLLARQSFSKRGDFGTGRLLLAEDPPGDMPPFGYFSSRQIFEIVAYLRGLEDQPAEVVRNPPSPVLDGAYKYVAVDGAIRVYDLGREYAMVKQIRVKNQITIRGIAASHQTGLLYVAFDGLENSISGGGLVCIDLTTDKVRWVREYPSGIDSMALGPDGARIYMPTGEGLSDGAGQWLILDALTGDERSRVTFGVGAHNTIIGPDGTMVYLAAVQTDHLGVLNVSTERIVGQIGPFGSSVRPFTLTSNGKYALVNVDFLSGFEVADLELGKVIHRVQVEGFPWEDPAAPGPTQSHGIALTPDETEAWVADAWNRYVHIFAVSDLPVRPKQIDSVNVSRPGHDDGFLPKWINFSRDGRYVHISNGAIIDAKSRQIVRWIVESRHFIEIHFQQGKPVAAFPRYGLGYAGPAWWSSTKNTPLEN